MKPSNCKQIMKLLKPEALLNVKHTYLISQQTSIHTYTYTPRHFVTFFKVFSLLQVFPFLGQSYHRIFYLTLGYSERYCFSDFFLVGLQQEFVYRMNSEFWELVLYPAFLLKLFMHSRSFLADILGSLMYTTIEFINNDILTFYQVCFLLISLSYLCDLVNTSGTALNMCGQSTTSTCS